MVGAAGSLAYSLLEGFGSYLLAGFSDSYPIDMQFTNAEGVSNSGLYFKDGMGSYTEREAIAYFIENSSDDTSRGTIRFSKFGLDSHYEIYDGAIYHEVASYLGMSLESFLAVGQDDQTNIENFISGSVDRVIFNSDQPLVIYIPVKINGVTSIMEVGGIFIDDARHSFFFMQEQFKSTTVVHKKCTRLYQVTIMLTTKANFLR